MFGGSTASAIMERVQGKERQSKQRPPTRTAIKATKQDER